MMRFKRWAVAACIGALTGLLVFAALASMQRQQPDAPLGCGHSQSWFSKVSGRRDDCRYKAIISDQRQIACAALLYFDEHGEYPASLEALAEGMYKVVPIHVQNCADYQYQISFVNAEDGLYILASSAKHERVFVLFVDDEFSGSAFNKAGASTSAP